MESLSELLSQIDPDDSSAREKVFPLVYDELRMLASRKLSREKPGQTLQATALVHEAFLKLVKVDRWNSRQHFFAIAADAMQKILVDQARRKATIKRGGGTRRVELDSCMLSTPEIPCDLLALDAALTELAATNPKAAQIVKLRFFVGLSIAEAAATMGISPRSANRWWASARAWLAVELGRIDRSRRNEAMRILRLGAAIH